MRVLVIATAAAAPVESEKKYKYIFMSYGCSIKRKNLTENITNVQNMIKIAFFHLYRGFFFSCMLTLVDVVCSIFVPLVHVRALLLQQGL